MAIWRHPETFLVGRPACIRGRKRSSEAVWRVPGEWPWEPKTQQVNLNSLNNLLCISAQPIGLTDATKNLKTTGFKHPSSSFHSHPVWPPQSWTSQRRGCLYGLASLVLNVLNILGFTLQCTYWPGAVQKYSSQPVILLKLRSVFIVLECVSNNRNGESSEDVFLEGSLRQSY